MKRAIIIDDEEKSRITLATFLQKYCPSIELIGEAYSVASGVDQYQKLDPDVLFLDIEMEDGTGFDVIELLSGNRFEVIFVTAYNQYAIRAFRCSAIDYLLKPLNPEELIHAVAKLSNVTRIDQIEKKLEALISNRISLHKIIIPSMDGMRLEEPENINYFESDNYYSIIHLKTGEKLMVSKTLKEYDKLLSADGFFRIHQKFLVRVAEINKYSKAEGGFVVLKDGTQLTVSRRKKEALLELLTS